MLQFYAEKIVTLHTKNQHTNNGYDKKQAFSVSYDFSQKIHNALKWLMKKQGKRYGGLNVAIWASAEDVLLKAPDKFIDNNIEDDFLKLSK